MTQQIIDSKTGDLILTNGFIVSQQTKPEQVISYFTKENLDIRDMHNGWKHYSVLNFKVIGTYFSMTFYFDNNTLKSLNFIVSNKVILMRSWDDWSEDEELKNRDYYDDWLTNQIGKAREFSWGNVNAFYDSKGASSGIFLKYN